MMKRVLIALSLLCTQATAADYQTSVGIGHQYGGIIGAQLAYKTEQSKTFASLGVVGAAVGFQTSFQPNSQYSYGIVLGREEFQSEDGFVFITGNYHFNGFNQPGWTMGLGLGITREDDGGFFADRPGTTSSESSFTLNIGYEF